MSRSITLVPSIGQAAARGPFERIVAAFAWLRQEFRLQRDLRAVEAMDDRALADIGLGRSEAEAALRHGRAAIRGRRGQPTGSTSMAPLMPASWTEWR